MFECGICNKKLPFDFLWGIKHQWDGHLMLEQKNICKRCAFNNIGEKISIEKLDPASAAEWAAEFTASEIKSKGDGKL